MTKSLFQFLFLLTLSTTAHAIWVGTGTCCVTCCVGPTCASACGSGSETFSSQAACLAREAQGTGVCSSYTGCTVDSFTPGTCTESGGSGSGSTTNLGEFFQNPVIQEALSDYAGNTPTAGTGGLSQNFGANNKVAREQGEASFTKHANSANESWLREAAARISVHANSNLRAGSNPYADARNQGGMERAAQFFTAWISPSKTLTSPLTGDSVPRESAEYQANYIGGVVIPIVDQNNPQPNYIGGNVIPTVDPSKPRVDKIEGGGQPITGEGVKVGAKDTPPPPSPETPTVPQVEGRVQTGASACRDPKWLFNSQTQMCYPSMKSCTAADKKGVCR